MPRRCWEFAALIPTGAGALPDDGRTWLHFRALAFLCTPLSDGGGRMVLVAWLTPVGGALMLGMGRANGPWASDVAR